MSSRPGHRIAAGICLLALSACIAPLTRAAPPASEAADSEIEFVVHESALMELLLAVTPYTLTVGNRLISVDLLLMEPRDLALAGGEATLRLRVKGKTLPVDQIIHPVITVEYDATGRRYQAIVSSLPVQVPGLGRVDLRDALPPFDIPSLVENILHVEDKALDVTLRFRRIVIGEHRLEIGADLDVRPERQSRRTITPSGRAAGRP